MPDPNEKVLNWLKTPVPTGLTLKEFEELVQTVIPWGVVASDNEGQLIIYTSLMLDPFGKTTDFISNDEYEEINNNG